MAALRPRYYSPRYDRAILLLLRITLDHLLSAVPVTPPQTYLTLSLRNLGFTTIQTNLLSIPSFALGIMFLVLMAFYSELINSRVGATIVLQLWVLPLLIALHSFNKDTSQWIYFAVVSLIVGYPYVHPIQVAWASRNSYSVRTRCVTNLQNLRKLNTNKDNRTISASVYNMCVQLGSIISVSDIDRHRLQTNVRTQRQIYIVQTTNLFVRLLILKGSF